MIMITDAKLNASTDVWNRYWEITIHMNHEESLTSQDNMKKQILNELLKDVLDLSIDDIKKNLPEYFI